ncbi:helix-turn-helix domain-containing protein [Nicoliella spurrieriana]|uniref:Helix-turn-helix domain-containing protein n=1 Tax=Nicoliella spurrieriana TaxID=2925830 RepID=A0A976RSR0_9LACO|nr:helix-turn-helix transcriptional regulator [Nicoliella spurrieriana]UQS87157.1 helix-turn-helix domain-containing protein [Nicoliella spurrieriana]
MLSIFGQRLRALRRGRNLTQSQLAAALNNQFDAKPHPNTEAQLGKWELGLRSPSIPELIKLATFFNVSIDFLVGRNDDNIKDVARELISASELQFNATPLDRNDKREIFELIHAYLLGKEGRNHRHVANHKQQEELRLDFGPQPKK